MNTVSIIGRLGKDPEVKELSSGKTLASFSLAYQRDKETTDWFRVECWDRQAETARSYLVKGSQVAITGRLQVHKIVKDGEPDRELYKIVASNITLIGAKPEGKKEAKDEYDPFAE